MELSSFSVRAMTRRRPLTPHRTVQPVHSTTHASQGKHSPSHSSNTDSSSSSNKSGGKLKRTLELHDLIFYGVGCSVGAGIYSLVGIGASLAGPSIALSFLLCGVACCFTSLSYAEFATRVPLAGSAYTFTYVSFGELCGWLVGWNLTLGYAVSAAVVARSWAEYLVGFMEGFRIFSMSHINLDLLTKFPIPLFGMVGYTCCPLSMVIIGLCTIVLVSGAKESTRFNTCMTIFNLTVLGFVLCSGVATDVVDRDNLTPIFPHGLEGMARGAGLVFFSYLGFDMVACLSEEVKNPERNMPIGIIGSLLVSMSIYVTISIVIVGMAPAALLGQDIPIINALLANACCTHEDQMASISHTGIDATTTCLSYANCDPVLHAVLYFGSRVISFGAIFGLTTATFACLMGQPRIFYSMAQDGLLFKIYARVHPETGVPTVGTVITGVFTAIVACLIDLESLANAISLGTLQVFTFVNAGVILLRMQPPRNKNNGSKFTTLPLAPLLSPGQQQLDGSMSPLGRDTEAMARARSIGLVKQTSKQLRRSTKRKHKIAPSVSDNGTKPIWLVLVFTMSAILATWSMNIDSDKEQLQQHDESHFSGSSSWQQVNHHHYRGATLASICCFLMVLCAVWLFQLPKSAPPETFTCPMVPGVPLMGIVCNSYMMGSMTFATWSVILVWLLVGLLFYFVYGIHHSELRTKISTRTPSKQRTTNDNDNVTVISSPQEHLALLVPTHSLICPASATTNSIMPQKSANEGYCSINK